MSKQKKLGEDSKKVKVLLEMRPALEGFAGIPQEVRLLFRGLRKIDSVDVEGLIQTSHRILSAGIPDAKLHHRKMTPAKKINYYSRTIISLAEQPYKNIFVDVYDYLQRKVFVSKLLMFVMIGRGKVKLTRFESETFKDFIWRTMFSKTLPASDFDLVTSTDFRVCTVPWHMMHMVGLNSLGFKEKPSYPTLDTKGIDIFIGQTPYPGNVHKDTTLIIRYHDAIPVLMPHTIPNKSVHQATHFYALMDNIRSGAWIACISESTRQDLLKIFPQAADKAVTIHNMVSHHYFNEPSKRNRVSEIIRSRLYVSEKNPKGELLELAPKFLTLKEKEIFYKKNLLNDEFKYLLIVSTIEPRKNHARLLAAWEVLKAEVDPNIKLVVVGTLGWDYMSIYKNFKTWIDRGDIYMLHGVPAPDLRVLYKHAEATVCPSLGEGFDFSGVESMASGGVTVASDIPVHREIYEGAAEYFDPYSTASLVKALKKVLYEDHSSEKRAEMRKESVSLVERYTPEKILPQWKLFIDRIAAEKKN